VEKINFLKSVPIFSELNDDTLDKVSKLGTIQSFKKNSIILSEEDAGQALFVIVDGKVKVSRISNDEQSKEVILSIMNPSDFFGEMALLDGFSRSATVTALEDSQVFIIQRNDFLELIKT
jgi:CRP/FNR family cyclic AMP-dependent transcriptional regulator